MSERVSRKDMGRKVRVKLMRAYGPYLDDKPIIPNGTICEGTIFGVDLGRGKVSTYLVTYRDFEYMIEGKDAKPVK
jgi:hypothetical protein